MLWGAGEEAALTRVGLFQDFSKAQEERTMTAKCTRTTESSC